MVISLRAKRIHTVFSDGKTVDESSVLEEVNDTILEAFNASTTVNETEVVNGTVPVANSPQTENSTEHRFEHVNSTTSPKWFCKGRNNTQNNDSLSQKVIIVNAEELLERINSTTDNETDACSVVLFFTLYCPFCAKLAPLYNAVGRVYNNLPILAVDAYKQHRLG